MAKINVTRVATLASLPIDASEEKKFGTQLESILDYVDQLHQVDTSQVEETSQVTGKVNDTREDEVTTHPPLVDGYIKVKAIFGND